MLPPEGIFYEKELTCRYLEIREEIIIARIIIQPPVIADNEGRSPVIKNTQKGFKTGSNVAIRIA